MYSPIRFLGNDGVRRNTYVPVKELEGSIMKRLLALSFAGVVSIAALASFAAGVTHAATLIETPSYSEKGQRAKLAQVSVRFVDHELTDGKEAETLLLPQ